MKFARLFGVRHSGVCLLVACILPTLASAAVLSGTVQSGGTLVAYPLRNVAVSLYEATAGAPSLVSQATSDASGHFSILSFKNTSSSIFFVTADVRAAVQYVAVLGANLPASITVNELTSVAASYSMAQFYRRGVISGDSFALRIATGMNDNLVDISTGASSPVLLNSPNGDETNSLRMTRTLANLLAACLQSQATTGQFLSLTTLPGACRLATQHRAWPILHAIRR
jgi:hypothetical protein